MKDGSGTRRSAGRVQTEPPCDVTSEPGSILPASTPEDARRPSRILVVVVVGGGGECTTLIGVASVRARGRIISRS